MLKLFAILFLTSILIQAFDIPLPLGGNLMITKKPDGETEFSIGQNVNILGFGGNRNLTFTAGKNGTFDTKTDGGVLVNGTKFGGGTDIGANSGGVVLDNNVQFNNKSIQGGVGKETNFITQLIDAIAQGGKSRKAKP